MKKKQCCLLLVAVLLFSALLPAMAATAATVRLNKKTLTLEVGETALLRMQGTDKTVQWSSKNKKIATVSKTGKVTAVRAGTTSIYAAIGKKQYACEVTILPEWKMDEESLAGELNGRFLEMANGQSLRISEDEIREVEILSRLRSKDNRSIQIRARVEIDRTIALLSSEVTLLYRNTSSKWKLTQVTAETKVEEWNLEGVWKGGVKVYDYSRNTSESRDLMLDIFDVKEDGIFECEATLIGTESDVITMSGELNEETGEIELIGQDWVDASSDLAKSLSRKGKVYSFYVAPDFTNDAFVSQDGISVRVTYASDLLVEKDMDAAEEDTDTEEEDGDDGWRNLDDEEDQTEEDMEEDDMENGEEDMNYEE